MQDAGGETVRLLENGVFGHSEARLAIGVSGLTIQNVIAGVRWTLHRPSSYARAILALEIPCRIHCLSAH